MKDLLWSFLVIVVPLAALVAAVIVTGARRLGCAAGRGSCVRCDADASD